MSSSPKQRYQNDLARTGFIPDAAQERAVEMLEDLYWRLLHRYGSNEEGFINGLIARFRKPLQQPEKGLYFWGGVGRGKTYLMDNFYESLPLEKKMRAHFHRFMRRVHLDLKTLKGEKDPLEKVAQLIADEAVVICFDEFFVSDITDAMILGTLLKALFERGITLVTTSNIQPEELYRDGLQRARFLPAIALLKTHCAVVNVDGGVDYRLRALERAELYHYGVDYEDRAVLEASFASLVPAEEEIAELVDVEIEGRRIETHKMAEDVIWFDFSAICEGPRSQNDYIEIAREFHAVLIGGVPRLDATRDDAVRRFINLVDEFYDRNVKLILSAAAPLEQLYAGGRLEFEFQRTRSRLLEMQSHEYLARPHRP